MSEERPARASAPGKVIVLGEHFVVLGTPAIAAAIDSGIEVTVEKSLDRGVSIRSGEACDNRSVQMIETIMRELGLPDETGLVLDVRSEIPSGAGLGTSAALSVAAARAISGLLRLDPSDENIFSAAFKAEAVVHGTSSGIDPFISTHGGLIWYEKGPPRVTRMISPGRSMELVIGLTSERGDTGEMVAGVAGLAERNRDVFSPLVDAASRLVHAGLEAIESGDHAALGEIMNICHGLLCAIGVSTPGLDALVHAAREVGALGAKLTGAGGGGAVIALCPGRQDAVCRCLENAGATSVIPTTIITR